MISVQPIFSDESGTPPPNYEPKLDAYLAKHRGEGEIKGVLKLGGSIPAGIRYTAEELGCDLIVMGSHDPHFTDYLIGSNAAHVALHTPCSVLVVRWAFRQRNVVPSTLVCFAGDPGPLQIAIVRRAEIGL